LAKSKGITVLLDGNGVDEIFLGYKRYHQIFVQSAKNEFEKSKRSLDYESFWGEAVKSPSEGRSIDGTSGLRPNVISNHFLENVEPLKPIKVQGFADPVRYAAAEDLLHAKIPRGLRFNDRVSMAHSRELRVPFLDHRLVEFAFGIPTEKLFGSKGTKLIFRNLLARKASDNVAYAAKRSVQSPQREWLAKDWRRLVESILSSDSFRERGWFSVEEAKNAYKAYLSGDNENSFFIWQWINLELWAREYLIV
jgi:asparagine synthase (glutamine-hydrolysing)